MKKLRNFVISLTVVATLFLSPLTTFAIYSDNLPNGFVIKWYKDENPTLTIRDTSYNVLQTVTSGDIATVNEYGFSNKAFNNVGYLFFTNHTYPINFQYLPQVYDYYLIATVVSGNGVTESGFSFVPEVVGWWDYECNGIEDVVYSTDVFTYHHDDGNTTGFTTVAKLPTINNTALKGFHFEDLQGGTFPASVRITPVLCVVPKDNSNSGSGHDHSTIESLLSQILTYDQLTYDKLDVLQDLLNEIHIMIFEEGATDFEDIDKSEDTDQIGDLNEAEKELIGDTSDYEQRLDITINPTATKVVWDSVDPFVQGNGKVFAMFITLLSLGFIKLVLNR